MLQASAEIGMGRGGELSSFPPADAERVLKHRRRHDRAANRGALVEGIVYTLALTAIQSHAG
jgi:hypothetical protein